MKRDRPDIYEKLKASGTWYKPGQRTHVHPVGHIKVDPEGYRFIKVKDDVYSLGNPKSRRNWKPLRVHIWEQAHGPLPQGHVVMFLDGDKTNMSLDNLKAVSRAENAVLNHSGLRFEDPQLTKTGIAIAKVLIKTKERERG